MIFSRYYFEHTPPLRSAGIVGLSEINVTTSQFNRMG